MYLGPVAASGRDVPRAATSSKRTAHVDLLQESYLTAAGWTVRWDLSKLDETATRLKAVIRNTLLGDAKQEDK